MAFSSFTVALECNLRVPEQVKLQDGVHIEFSVTNPSATAAIFLPWYTPIEGFWSDMFYIQREEGQVLKYEGPLAKRSSPSQADHLTLAGDTTLTAALDLSLVYRFDVGRYTLTFKQHADQLPCLYSLQQSWLINIEP
ncbi:hypothetical protein PALB_580 [Pseudoalteromonas luteoviolacea B = ATCC 29581]|nr:hypothetical protein PALB_580 [Pseudoalteromonas luteoviolacea B = ATCC 29581]